MSALDAMPVADVARWFRAAGEVLIRKDAALAAATIDCLGNDASAALGAQVMDIKVARAHENHRRVDDIIRGVGARHVVAVSAIKSANRRKHVVAARAHAAWLLKHRLNLSYPAIGEVLGRHHTVAMDLVSKWQERVDAQKGTT